MWAGPSHHGRGRCCQEILTGQRQPAEVTTRQHWHRSRKRVATRMRPAEIRATDHQRVPRSCRNRSPSLPGVRSANSAQWRRWRWRRPRWKRLWRRHNLDITDGRHRAVHPRHVRRCSPAWDRWCWGEAPFGFAAPRCGYARRSHWFCRQRLSAITPRWPSGSNTTCSIGTVAAARLISARRRGRGT